MAINLAEISSGIDCDDKNAKCGLKAYYKDEDRAVFKPIVLKDMNKNVYASKFSPENIDKNGGFYIDDSINFNFNRTQDKRHFSPYKNPIDPVGAPLQISQNNWSVKWEGGLYVKDAGIYAFFTDDFEVDFSIKLNEKFLNTNSLKDNQNVDSSDFLNKIHFINLRKGYHSISINFSTNSKNAKFSLLWLNHSNPKLTTGRTKFLNPTNQYELMRVIGKDSFTWNDTYISKNFNANVRVIDKKFFEQKRSYEWKFNSPTLTKYSGKPYSYCLISEDKYSKNGADIYAKYTQTQLEDKKIKLNYTISDKLATIKANECFEQNFSASPAISLAAFDKGTSKKQVVEFFNKHPNGNMNDSFSVIPAKFLLETDDKNILRAGKTSDIKISARDIDSKISRTYNAKLAQKDILFKHENIKTNTLIPKPNSISCKNDTDEILLDSLLFFKNGQNVQNEFNFDETASFKLNIIDDEFSSVDSNEYKNFNTFNTFKKAEILAHIHEYGYQCKDIMVENIVPSSDLVSCYVKNEDELILDVLPASFDVSASIFGANGENFVYTNNKENATSKMVATLRLNFTPKGLNAKVLKNFTPQCYAKDLFITLKQPKDTAGKTAYFTNINHKDGEKFTFSLDEDLSQNLTFNFDKNFQNKSPFFITNNDFIISNIALSDQKDVKFEFYKNDKTQKIVFLHGKAHIPLHDSKFSNMKISEYYGFYCKNECKELQNDENFSKLLKHSMPALTNYYTNEKHSEIFGKAKSYKSSFVGDEVSKFISFSKLENGVRELEVQNDSKKEMLKDRVVPNFDENVTWIEFEPFWLRFYRTNGKWQGKSYSANGSIKDNKNFIQNSSQERKNRRIEW